METLYRFKKPEGNRRPGKLLLPAWLLTVFIVVGCLTKATAQKSSFSDWNVPPPVSPAPNSNQVRGNAKSTVAKPIVLTLVDVPAPSLPTAPPIQKPILAAIVTMPAAVNTPDQPTLSNAGAGLTELPAPDAPDAPSMPKHVPADAVIVANTELPLPEAPEMPPFPKEPIPSGLATVSKTGIPLMPGVIGQPIFSMPVNGEPDIWSTPGIQQNESPQLVKPAGSKSIKPQDKGAANSNQHRAKTN